MKYIYERQPTKLDTAIVFKFMGHEVSKMQQSDSLVWALTFCDHHGSCWSPQENLYQIFLLPRPVRISFDYALEEREESPL